MHKRLFVTNLSRSVNEDELRALFAQYGEINSLHIDGGGESEREGLSAFVEMASDVSATAILEHLNGVKFEGRKLRIDEARERAGSGKRSFGSRH